MHTEGERMILNVDRFHQTFLCPRFNPQPGPRRFSVLIVQRV